MSTFKVNDMSCGHCEKTIKSEFSKTEPSAQVQVNLQDKTVTVENLADDRAIFLLKEIGYTPEKVK